jgi:hypothetical protein
MKEIRFADWAEVLTRSSLPDKHKRSWEITLRWYLSFCRRGRAEVSVQSARDFIAWAEAEKSPQPWQVEGWKEAINWFFREAAARPNRQAPMATSQSPKPNRPTPINHQPSPSLRRTGVQRCGDEGVATTTSPVPGTKFNPPSPRLWRTGVQNYGDGGVATTHGRASANQGRGGTRPSHSSGQGEARVQPERG